MSQYYYDEVREVAYKIDPILVSEVGGSNSLNPKGLLVHTDVKMTNYRREKVRRTICELFPQDSCDPETAKKQFSASLLGKLTRGARRISEEEYLNIKANYEYTM
ncbi:MAG TPA: hypothetical protein VHS59_01100 [Bacillota bacterium]|nr:hypothetical protein [Bacillota bacterium]